MADDAKERQDSGGVAGVAAQRSGDVAVAVGAQDADGQGLRRLAMAGGRCRYGLGRRPWRRWCRGGGAAPRCPVPAEVVGQAGGLAWAAVRLVTTYTVTVRQRRLPSGRTRRVIRRAWVAWGKSRPAMV